MSTEAPEPGRRPQDGEASAGSSCVDALVSMAILWPLEKEMCACTVFPKARPS